MDDNEKLLYTDTDPVVRAFRIRQAAKAELLLKRQVTSKLKTDLDGTEYALRVAKLKCWACGQDRWNDGTRCKSPNCGMYPKGSNFRADAGEHY